MPRHEFVVVGRPVSRRSSSASKRRYKGKVKRAAQDVLPATPSGEFVALTVRYFHWGQQRIDGDNILSLICDALNEVAYYDDSQIVTHHIDSINMTQSYRLIDPPEQVVDHLEGREEFVWVSVGPVRVIRIS